MGGNGYDEACTKPCRKEGRWNMNALEKGTAAVYTLLAANMSGIFDL